MPAPHARLSHIDIEKSGDSWSLGDKLGLWREVVETDVLERSKKRRKGGVTDEAQEVKVNKLAGLRLISKAVQTIISPGVKEDTPQVERKLCGPWGLPEAMVAELADFLKQLHTFKTGAGPGPTI